MACYVAAAERRKEPENSTMRDIICAYNSCRNSQIHLEMQTILWFREGRTRSALCLNKAFLKQARVLK